MTPFILFITSLFLLYPSKTGLSTQFSKFIHRLGGNRNTLIVFWSVIFLPGTVIHEMSHFLMAILTGARTGKIEIFPRFLEEDWEREERNSGVTLGYVQTQKLNIIQGFLVGTAPFFVGIALLTWLGSLIQDSYSKSQFYKLLLQGYLFFTLSNSFFPSWTDIKHTLPLIVTVSVLGLALWFFGFQLILNTNSLVPSVLYTMSITLFVSSAINIVITIIFFLLNRAKAAR